MTSTWSGLVRGAAAGAAGTTALNVTTQLDMAVRDRPASDAPEQVVSELVDRSGVDVPGGRRARARRIAALAPVTGSATGVAIGGAAGMLRSAGVRLPGVLGAPLLAAAAMLAADGPVALLGISDPRSWSATDWAADVVPHLVYGVTTHAALVSAIPDEQVSAARPPAGVLVRAAAIGAATGARSSAGITVVALTSSHVDRGLAARLGSRPGTAVTGLLAAAELVADKHPATPTRTESQGLVPRVALSAASASAVAQRSGHDGSLAAVVGAAAALASAFVFVRGRAAAARRFGSDLPGAFAEDTAAVLLGWWGARRV